MNTQWPQFRVRLEAHTVETAPGVFLAGYLVRCTSSRRDLGRVWKAGNSFRWRTTNGHGERSTERAAVEAVRDAADVLAQVSAARGPEPPPPGDRDILDAWRTVSPRPHTTTTPRTPRTFTPTAAPAPKPVPPPRPVRHIVWDDSAPAFDVTAAVKDALRTRK